MKKIGLYILCLLLLAVLFTGCGPSPAGETGETITITDQGENQVTLPKDIQRIAVCDIYPLPSVLVTFFDSAERIVAMDNTSKSAMVNGLLGELYPEIGDVESGAIQGTDVNMEELMKTDPQVVFYNAASPQLGEDLQKSGFNAVALAVNGENYDVSETLESWLDLLTQIFPETSGEKADKVKKYCGEVEELIRSRTEDIPEAERARIIFLLQCGENSLVGTGKQSFGRWWAEAVGAVNAADELMTANSGKITMEQIYKWDPDQIYLTNFNKVLPEDLLKNRVGNYDWSGLSAIQNQKVYKMPLGMYRSYTPGVDSPLTMLWLAKSVYPDRFTDVEMEEQAKGYYRDIFGITLTDEQVRSIFSPATDTGVSIQTEN